MAAARLLSRVLLFGIFVDSLVRAHRVTWIHARATFYGGGPTLGGACGYENTYAAGFGQNTAAVSGALFRNGEACGACYLVACDRKLDPQWCLPPRAASVTVTATNFCPANHRGGWCDPPNHHFDMSTPAFLQIARPGPEGIVPVLYTRVTCRRRGGVRFTLKGQANFNMVMISNVGGSGEVRSAWVRSGSGAWAPMSRNWGANWQITGGVEVHSKTLSFRVSLAGGSTLDFLHVVPSSWNFGQTFASSNQFS
ncbi:expansin-A12-like [Andrographis paniculata]|uniref:expansin-A12-like n=1 Tax=Andrographis paniculata TaxID=175694 RepID=UPI0021E80CC4|nr:expansin-A12-like [Andrographis paniculata]